LLSALANPEGHSVYGPGQERRFGSTKAAVPLNVGRIANPSHMTNGAGGQAVSRSLLRVGISRWSS
jgi:hypothetical protein